MVFSYLLFQGYKILPTATSSFSHHMAEASKLHVTASNAPFTLPMPAWPDFSYNQALTKDLTGSHPMKYEGQNFLLQNATQKIHS